MEGTGTRWLVTLFLLTAAQCPARVTAQTERDSEDSRRVLGSSVVTSVSVIMDHGNGTKTYFADGQSKHVHKPTDRAVIGSPGNLLSPDRYEFYTFDETGDLVKRLMTLDEIHGLIAGADPESVMADASPTYYHDALSSHSSEALMHLPATDLESLDAPAVHKVLESVQNVLKNEMAANSGKPAPQSVLGGGVGGGMSLHRPDSASAWSALFPGLIETPDDVAHLSGYLLPSKTAAAVAAAESTDRLSSTKRPQTTAYVPPSTSVRPSLSSATTNNKLPPSTTKTYYTPSTTTSSTTEKVRSTPKYTTVGPDATTKFAQPHVTTTAKPTTSKKPFRPAQSFDKQKPAPQKPTLVSHATARPSAAAADGLDINKEMSASISDMLSQVTDSQSANRHKPLQTNALVEKDNAADYVPEESSPELSYYSPVMAAVSSSTAAGAATTRPVAEALTSVKRPFPSSQTTTVAVKTTGTETPFSQKIASGTSATRFGPTKANATRPRPPANATAATATYTAKPAAFNKYNGTAAPPSTTRNNYQYPPSNMSTKYMQKITQTTQAYPNKLIDSSVKVVNKTVNNATLSVKQQPSSWSETRWNLTEDAKNKFHGGPDKVFQTKVTSARPGGINRTNVTLSNRVQEPKTTAAPDSTAGYSTTTGAVRGTAEPDKFVSVKVEEWPTMTVQHRPTAWPTTTPYASTEKSFYSGQPLSAITDPNAIRDLLSSLMVKSTTASSASTGTVSPTTASVGTVQTLTAAVSTTTTTPSTTTTAAANATSESTTTTAAAAATATALSMVKTAIEEATTATTASATTAGTTTAGTTTAGTTTTGSSTAGSTTAGTTTTGSSTAGSTTAGTTTAGTTTTGSTTAGPKTTGSTTTGSTAADTTTAGTTTAGTTTSSSTTSGTTTSSTTATGTTATGTTSAGTTAASPTTAGLTAAAMASKTPDATWTTTVPSTTPESETQYVPVTHFLPELQVKDRPETDTNNNNNNNNNNHSNNNNTGGNVAPGVDAMLKDGISAVANMLQNTQKPAIVGPEYPETGPDEDATMAAAATVALAESDDQRQSSTTEQARRQPTIKTDADETTAAAATQDAYESTAATEPTTRWPDNDNDTDTVAQMSRISEPGLEMLTVFNVSSTGGPVQVAKLADLSAETPSPYDGTTTPFAAATDASQAPAATTEEPAAAATTTTAAVTLTPATSSTTAAASPSATVSAATVASSSATVASSSATVDSSSATAAASSSSTITAKDAAATPAAPAQNATAAPGVKSPGPSSNAYRPPANGGAASPSTVELHPAPHESMGLEASVAFLGDDVRRFADLCNELSFKMWTAVTGKGQIASRSLVLSPFELTAMLAMVFLGARGSTSGQMNDILRLDDMVTFNPHQVLRNITHSITNGNNPGVATASFVREIYSHKGNGKILDFYKERVQQYYDGHVEEVDFNAISDVLRRRTNLLVKRQTLGRVVEYLRGSGLSLTPPFAAFSANVFQTSCEGASTEGRDGEMYFVVRPSTRQRRLVPVPAAVWRGGFLAGYEPGLDATAVCLSPDSAVSTVLVLPGQQGQVAPGDGLARLEQRLIETSYRRGGWSRVLRSLLPRPGLELQVPRFSHRSVLNATAALQRMGLRDVFNEQRADLRGVNGLYDLHLSDMLQVNTFSTCGEDTIGARHHVETYPASPQRMGRAEETPRRRRRRRSGQPDDLPLHSPYSHLPLNLRPRQARLPDVPRLRFDRPFLYLVRHNPTGMIVYLGRFNPRLLP